MKIVITLEVPEGTAFNVGPSVISVNGGATEPEFVPAFADELIPLPDAIPIPGDPVPFRGAAQNAPQDAQCPVHRTAWQIKPAGVSKKTGKPYNAFWACPERMCDQRPSYAFIQSHPAA